MADRKQDKDEPLLKKQAVSKDSDANASEGGLPAKAQAGVNSATNTAQSAAGSFKDVRRVNPLNSVGIKLFLIIFGSIVACVLTVGLMAYNEAKSMVEKKVSDASLQTINQVAGNLDIIYRNLEDLTLQILIDKDFHTLVSTMKSNSGDYERFEASRKLSEKMQAYSLGNNNIKGITLVPLTDGLQVITSGSGLSSRIEEIKQSEWFEQTVQANGRTNWITPQDMKSEAASNQLMIGLSRLLKDSVTSDASYVLLLEFDIGVFESRYSDVHLGEDSELAIVDANGNYVIAGNRELIGQPANVLLPAEGAEASHGSPKLTTTDGVEVLAVYKRFEATDWKLVGTIPVNELVKDAKAIQNLTWITLAVAAVLAIAIGVLVIVTIARPLVKICALMMEGARGNLTVRSAIRKRRDEIGSLSESFNSMMGQITELAQRTTRSAEDVLATAADLTDASKKTSEAAKEIAIATEEIAGGATSLAVEAERGNELTTHMNAQMQIVIAANREMATSASAVEKASGQGTSYMAMLMEKTGTTEEMTRSMVEKVDALKESTGSIVKILDVLHSLTKQTNILSLNATIEAARAGAAGKGFMVVADEIRKLADQSRQSIDVVAQITEKIGSEIEETVHVLSEAYPLFKEQIDSVKEASGIFVSVQEQMGVFVNRLDSASESIKGLDQSQTVLAEAMTNVSAVAEEASATSEEVASLSNEQLGISGSLVQLSEKLDNVSRGLKEALSQFKI